MYLSRLWLSGSEIDWLAFSRYQQNIRLHVPTYPFERQRYWADQLSPGGSSTTIEKQPDISDWLYVPGWQYSIPGISPQSVSNKPSCWLVFEDNGGVGSAATAQLSLDGQGVVSVVPGKQFARLDFDRYSIHPGRPGDYLELLSALYDSQREPDNIIHAWSLCSLPPRRSEGTLFGQCQEVRFFSLIYFVQALARLKTNRPVQIVAVSNNLHAVTGDEQIYASKATLLGACKCIPQEFPNITCRNVDIDDAVAKEDTAAELISILSERPSETVIAFRGGQRWVQVFEPLSLSTDFGEGTLLRHHGVYLITGGLGRIGLTLAAVPCPSSSGKACPNISLWFPGTSAVEEVARGTLFR